MSTRHSPAPLTLFALAALLVAMAGCVSPGSGDVCQSPQGEVGYLMETQDGSLRGVPATDETRWSIMVTCSETFRAIDTLRITVETPEHGRLVAEVDATLPNDETLTLYALVRQSGTTSEPGSASLFQTQLPSDSRGVIYRMRITDDDRSREGLDERDLIGLTVDTEGHRNFESQLSIGTYRLTIQDRLGGEQLGSLGHQFFDPRIAPTEDGTSGTPPGAGGGGGGADRSADGDTA